MATRHRINDLIETGWRILDSPGDDYGFVQWKAQALESLTEQLGQDHIYVSYMRDFLNRAGRLGVLSAVGILDVARGLLTENAPKKSGEPAMHSPDTIRRRIMRIDYGPNFQEIRDSIQQGKAVTFGSTSGEKLLCVVLDAKIDCERGRAALTVEETETATVYFVRYSYRGERRCCGDLVTWRLKLNEIEELRRTA